MTNQVTHFWRKQLFSDNVIDKAPLDLPEVELDTEAAWIVLPREITDRARRARGEVVGASFLIELAALGGRARLDVPCHAVLSY